MSTSLNGLSANEPAKSSSSAKFYGAFPAEIRNATVQEQRNDKNGNPYYKVFAEAFYKDSSGNERSTKFYGVLPYDWKNEDRPFGSLYEALGTAWESLLENFEKETNKKITVLIGAQSDWNTGGVKTYVDSKGKERISYGVIGFAPYSNDPSSAWSDALEAHEISVYKSFSSVKEREIKADVDSLSF